MFELKTVKTIFFELIILKSQTNTAIQIFDLIIHSAAIVSDYVLSYKNLVLVNITDNGLLFKVVRIINNKCEILNKRVQLLNVI